MNIKKLQDDIQKALDKSIKWGEDNNKSNSARSAYFSNQAALSLPCTPTEKLLHVGFDESTHEKTPGEWLLDAVIAELDGDIVKTIHIAMECESKTSMREFSRDFGKLLNIKSKVKLYLHGLNHSTKDGAEKLISNRLEIAAKLICDIDKESEWYFGFWPSPEKVTNFPSLWDGLGEFKEYNHLSSVRMFKFNGTSFTASP